MSCWRTYTCDVLKNVNRDIVVEALKDLGMGINLNEKTVHGRYEGRSSAVDGVLINREGRQIDVGVRFNDNTGHLSLVGDFWRTGLDAQTFQDNLSQAYQKINIMHQAELNGWTVDEETMETTEDGSIEMEVYMYA